MNTLRNLIIALMVSGLAFLSITTSAQYCIPEANCSFGDNINSFSFGSIANTNSAGSNCSDGSYINVGSQTSVIQGESYSFSIQSGIEWEQGFGIWIDYNGDEDFNDANEFVYSNATPTTSQLSGSVTIPLNATPGVTRMRVRSKYASSVGSAESCNTFTYGETEDYSIEIQENEVPPISVFTANTTSSCNPEISFFDLSSFNPHTWTWYFGDATTSSLQNPSHTYSGPGTYDVSLVVVNDWGTDSIGIDNYITIHPSDNVPIDASCTPATSDNSSGFGITNVQFGSINNTSSDASAEYEDFTCVQTSVLAGQSYSLDITLDNTAPQNVKVWIDYNNDGAFNNSTELIAQGNQVTQLSESVFIPSASIQNQALRMRIVANYYFFGAVNSCDDIDAGQAEDYTVTVEPNTNPPVSLFEISDQITCDGAIQFTDLSENVPTSFSWDFGDNVTSVEQNPIHIYNESDTFTVSLIASNQFGVDTLTWTDAVIVNFDGAVSPINCAPITTSHLSNYGIYKVGFNTISNFSNGGEESYQDYSCEYSTSVVVGESIPVDIRTGADNTEDVKVYIDLNNDAVFDAVSELMFESSDKNFHFGSIDIPLIDSLNIPLRMRVMSDFVGANISPCNDVQWGQVEDYSIVIKKGVPIANFIADSTKSCGGTIDFTDLTANNPESWEWNFGDGSTSFEQNPTHTYSSFGAYTVSLKASNSIGFDTDVKFNYIMYDDTICDYTNVQELADVTDFSLFPNPTNGQVTIQVGLDEICQVQLINMLGDVMANTSIKGSLTFDLTNYAKGTYFVKLTSGDAVEVKKLVVK